MTDSMITQTRGALMTERFSGLMILFVKRAMPDFGPIFTRYADDLRREAERGAQ